MCMNLDEGNRIIVMNKRYNMNYLKKIDLYNWKLGTNKIPMEEMLFPNENTQLRQLVYNTYK